MEKVAQIKWGRGKFSEVFRSTIINPSPIRPGQKVQIIWGETKKEYTAVVECYPVEKNGSQPVEVETELPQRRARTKRKLVSKDFTFYHSRFINLRCFLTKSNNFFIVNVTCWFTLQIHDDYVAAYTSETETAAKKNKKPGKLKKKVCWALFVYWNIVVLCTYNFSILMASVVESRF